MHKNFPPYFSLCCQHRLFFLAAFSRGLCSRQKASTQKFNFPPLLHTHKNGTDSTAVYSCTNQSRITQTGFQKPMDQLLLSGSAALAGGGEGVSFGRREKLKSGRGPESRSLPITLINRLKNIHSRNGNFCICN